MNKMRVKQCIVLYALLLYSATRIWGQTQDQYIKTMNSLVPVTPEASALMKYIDFPVSPFTGKANINIPICEVTGKSLSVPVSFSYVASSGIKINDMAGNVGLGFLLMCGGEITREVRGKPDEGCCGAVGLLQNANHPASYYYNNPNSSLQTTYLQNAAKGLLDLEPDLFYFSIAGVSGKFIYDETTSSFTCTQLEPYKVTFDLPNNKWQIVGPNGNIYLFEKSVTTNTQTICFPGSPSSGSPITTSWKLTKMFNADQTDSISLEYDYNTYYYYSEGSSTKYQFMSSTGGTPGRNSMDCFNKNTIDGWDHITSISSTTDTVKFQYGTDNRQDISQPQKALAYIIYSNGDPTAKKIFGMTYDYYLRNSVFGYYTSVQASTENTRSLRLDQITNYGNSTSNTNPLKWIFTYNSSYLPSRLSYNQDFWGYYNRNTTNNTLVPAQVLVTTDGNSSYSDGADRYADSVTMQAGVLTKIQFPTGGTDTFVYESNTVGKPTDLARPASYIPISNVIIQGNLPGNGVTPFGDESKTFTVNVINNPTAGMQDGVVATISVSPVTLGNYWSLDTSYFMLNKTSGSGLGFSREFGHNAVETVFLPNGTYTMNVINNGMTGPPINTGEGDMGTLAVVFDIAYNIPDTSHVASYVLGGLRIKSIVSTDQYSNVTSHKEFQYQDPVTDSSYGVFTGSTVHLNYDYLTTDHTVLPSGGADNDICQSVTYLARHGNCIMPFAGAAATVVYPKVTEYTFDGSKRYKTEYHYNYSIPFYNTQFPYVPPVSHESGDGRLLSSTVFQTVSTNNYWPAETINNQYNFTPSTQASNGTVGFGKLIPGFRVAFAGYTDNITCSYDYAYSNLYTTEINRADLTSDSIITYDLHNQYNGVKQWHDFVYGDINQQPIITRTGNSDGSVYKKENYFAVDFPGSTGVLTPGTFGYSLSLAHRYNELLATKSYKDNLQISQNKFYGHFSGSKMLIDSLQDALYGNPLQTEIQILAYDDAANPLQTLLKGGKYRKYIWNKNLPLATCVTANKDDFFYFTSFEYPGDGGTVGAAVTGNSGYHVSTNHPFSINTPPLTSTEVYFWAGTSSIFSYLVNGVAATSTGITRSWNGPWTLYKAYVSGNATQISITINSTVYTATIDQLVIFPRGSQFAGNVYDASNRIIATINDRVETKFFEYDPFGRLTVIRDEQGNVLKSTTYQYQAAQ